MRRSNSISLRLRFLAFATAFVFTSTNFTWAQIPAPALPTAPVSTVSLSKLSIPPKLGSIESVYQAGPDKPFVVYIQDAHAIVDAQNNISALIQYLEKTYGISLVALEGAKGRLDPTLLRAFPDEFVKKQVLKAYGERGELTGGEMAAIFSPQKSDYQGIEDWGMYEKNYLAYYEGSKRAPEISEELKKIQTALDQERKQFENKALYEFHNQTQTFYDEKISLVELWKFLAAYPVPARFVHLTQLFKALREEASLPQENIDISLRKMAQAFQKKVAPRLDQKSLREFNSAYQSFRSSQSDAGTFLRAIIDLGRKNGFSPKLTPQMKRLIGNVETLSNIQGTKVFDELEIFLKEIEVKMMTTDGERTLAGRHAQLQLWKNLIKFQLTRDQWHELNPSKFPETLKDDFAPFMVFYNTAQKRDQIFHEKLEKLMSQKKTQHAIVLTGGFHARGFEESLKEKDYSYAVVMPRMNSLAGQELYQGVMMGKVSYKKYLQSTFYDAFTRHSTLGLVNGLNEPDFRKSLKQWRDQVIRNLAQEGRIAEAGEYTRYIDMLYRVYYDRFGSKQPKNREEIQTAIDEELKKFKEGAAQDLWKKFEVQFETFKTGLNELVEKKNLNRSSLAQLFERIGGAQTSVVSTFQVLDTSVTRSDSRTLMDIAENRVTPQQLELAAGTPADYADAFAKQASAPTQDTLPETQAILAQLESAIAARTETRPADRTAIGRSAQALLGQVDPKLRPQVAGQLQQLLNQRSASGLVEAPSTAAAAPELTDAAAAGALRVQTTRSEARNVFVTPGVKFLNHVAGALSPGAATEKPVYNFSADSPYAALTQQEEITWEQAAPFMAQDREELAAIAGQIFNDPSRTQEVLDMMILRMRILRAEALAAGMGGGFEEGKYSVVLTRINPKNPDVHLIYTYNGAQYNLRMNELSIQRNAAGIFDKGNPSDNRFLGLHQGKHWDQNYPTSPRQFWDHHIGDNYAALNAVANVLGTNPELSAYDEAQVAMILGASYSSLTDAGMTGAEVNAFFTDIFAQSREAEAEGFLINPLTFLHRVNSDADFNGIFEELKNSQIDSPAYEGFQRIKDAIPSNSTMQFLAAQGYTIRPFYMNQQPRLLLETPSGRVDYGFNQAVDQRTNDLWNKLMYWISDSTWGGWAPPAMRQYYARQYMDQIIQWHDQSAAENRAKAAAGTLENEVMRLRYSFARILEGPSGTSRSESRTQLTSEEIQLVKTAVLAGDRNQGAVLRRLYGQYQADRRFRFENLTTTDQARENIKVIQITPVVDAGTENEKKLLPMVAVIGPAGKTHTVESLNSEFSKRGQQDFTHAGVQYSATFYAKRASAEEAIELLAGNQVGFRVHASVEEDYLEGMKTRLGDQYQKEGGTEGSDGRGYQTLVSQNIVGSDRSGSLYEVAPGIPYPASRVGEFAVNLERILQKNSSPVGWLISTYYLYGRPSAENVIKGSENIPDQMVGLAVAFRGAVDRFGRRPTDYINFLIPNTIYFQIFDVLQKNPELVLQAIQKRIPSTINPLLYERLKIQDGSALPELITVGWNPRNESIGSAILAPIDIDNQSQIEKLTSFSYRSESRLPTESPSQGKMKADTESGISRQELLSRYVEGILPQLEALGFDKAVVLKEMEQGTEFYVPFGFRSGTQVRNQMTLLKLALPRLIELKQQQNQKFIRIAGFGIGFAPAEAMDITTSIHEVMAQMLGDDISNWKFQYIGYDANSQPVNAANQVFNTKNANFKKDLKFGNLLMTAYKGNFLDLASIEAGHEKAMILSREAGFPETDDGRADIILNRHADYTNTKAAGGDLSRALDGTNPDVAAKFSASFLALQNALKVYGKPGSFYLTEPLLEFMLAVGGNSVPVLGLPGAELLSTHKLIDPIPKDQRPPFFDLLPTNSLGDRSSGILWFPADGPQPQLNSFSELQEAVRNTVDPADRVPNGNGRSESRVTGNAGLDRLQDFRSWMKAVTEGMQGPLAQTPDLEDLIRELGVNGLDAVVMRNLTAPADYAGQVTVMIDQDPSGTMRIVFEDNGLGMQQEVLRDLVERGITTKADEGFRPQRRYAVENEDVDLTMRLRYGLAGGRGQGLLIVKEILDELKEAGAITSYSVQIQTNNGAAVWQKTISDGSSSDLEAIDDASALPQQGSRFIVTFQNPAASGENFNYQNMWKDKVVRSEGRANPQELNLSAVRSALENYKNLGTKVDSDHVQLNNRNYRTVQRDIWALQLQVPESESRHFEALVRSVEQNQPVASDSQEFWRKFRPRINSEGYAFPIVRDILAEAMRAARSEGRSENLTLSGAEQDRSEKLVTWLDRLLSDEITTPGVRRRVEQVMEELTKNTFDHGIEGLNPSQVKVEIAIRIENDSAVIVLRDNANPYNPLEKIRQQEELPDFSSMSPEEVDAYFSNTQADHIAATGREGGMGYQLLRAYINSSDGTDHGISGVYQSLPDTNNLLTLSLDFKAIENDVAALVSARSETRLDADASRQQAPETGRSEARVSKEENERLAAELKAAEHYFKETLLNDIENLKNFVAKNSKIDPARRNPRDGDLEIFGKNLWNAIRIQTGHAVSWRSLATLEYTEDFLFRKEASNKEVFQAFFEIINDAGKKERISISFAVKKTKTDGQIDRTEVQKYIRLNQATLYDGSVVPIFIKAYSRSGVITGYSEEWIPGPSVYEAMTDPASYKKLTDLELKHIAATWTRAGRHGSTSYAAYPTDLNTANIMFRRERREPGSVLDFAVVDLGANNKQTAPHFFITDIVNNYVSGVGQSESPRLQALKTVMQGIRDGFDGQDLEALRFLMEALKGFQTWEMNQDIEKAVQTFVYEMVYGIVTGDTSREFGREILKDPQLVQNIQALVMNSTDWNEVTNTINSNRSEARDGETPQIDTGVNPAAPAQTGTKTAADVGPVKLGTANYTRLGIDPKDGKGPLSGSTTLSPSDDVIMILSSLNQGSKTSKDGVVYNLSNSIYLQTDEQGNKEVYIPTAVKPQGQNKTYTWQFSVQEGPDKSARIILRVDSQADLLLGSGILEKILNDLANHQKIVKKATLTVVLKDPASFLTDVMTQMLVQNPELGSASEEEISEALDGYNPEKILDLPIGQMLNGFGGQFEYTPYLKHGNYLEIIAVQVNTRHIFHELNNYVGSLKMLMESVAPGNPYDEMRRLEGFFPEVPKIMQILEQKNLSDASATLRFVRSVYTSFSSANIEAGITSLRNKSFPGIDEDFIDMIRMEMAEKAFEVAGASLGVADTKPERVELQSLLRNASARALLTNDVKVIRDFPDKLIHAYVRKVDFSEVITNLIKNAIEALQTVRREQKTIRITLSDEGEKFTVTIRDNGPGLTQEQLNLINTNVFLKTTKITGSGVGLPTIKGKIEEMGGALTPRSNLSTAQPGEEIFTEFEMELPKMKRSESRKSLSQFESRMDTTMEELIVNAGQAAMANRTNPNAPKVKVTLEIIPASAELDGQPAFRFVISDNGPGFNPVQLQAVAKDYAAAPNFNQQPEKWRAAVVEIAAGKITDENLTDFRLLRSPDTFFSFKKPGDEYEEDTYKTYADPSGVYPPYYAAAEEGFIFASGRGGLLIQKHIVDELGATVKMRNFPGNGFEVEILLPVNNERVDAAPGQMASVIRQTIEANLQIVPYNHIITELAKETGRTLEVEFSGESINRSEQREDGEEEEDWLTLNMELADVVNVNSREELVREANRLRRPAELISSIAVRLAGREGFQNLQSNADSVGISQMMYREFGEEVAAFVEQTPGNWDWDNLVLELYSRSKEAADPEAPREYLLLVTTRSQTARSEARLLTVEEKWKALLGEQYWTAIERSGKFYNQLLERMPHEAEQRDRLFKFFGAVNNNHLYFAMKEDGAGFLRWLKQVQNSDTAPGYLESLSQPGFEVKSHDHFFGLNYTFNPHQIARRMILIQRQQQPTILMGVINWFLSMIRLIYYELKTLPVRLEQWVKDWIADRVQARLLRELNPALLIQEASSIQKLQQDFIGLIEKGARASDEKGSSFGKFNFFNVNPVSAMKGSAADLDGVDFNSLQPVLESIKSNYPDLYIALFDLKDTDMPKLLNFFTILHQGDGTLIVEKLKQIPGLRFQGFELEKFLFLLGLSGDAFQNLADRIQIQTNPFAFSTYTLTALKWIMDAEEAVFRNFMTNAAAFNEPNISSLVPSVEMMEALANLSAEETAHIAGVRNPLSDSMQANYLSLVLLLLPKVTRGDIRRKILEINASDILNWQSHNEDDFAALNMVRLTFERLGMGDAGFELILEMMKKRDISAVIAFKDLDTSLMGPSGRLEFFLDFLRSLKARYKVKVDITILMSQLPLILDYMQPEHLKIIKTAFDQYAADEIGFKTLEKNVTEGIRQAKSALLSAILEKPAPEWMLQDERVMVILSIYLSTDRIDFDDSELMKKRIVRALKVLAATKGDMEKVRTHLLSEKNRLINQKEQEALQKAGYKAQLWTEGIITRGFVQNGMSKEAKIEQIQRHAFQILEIAKKMGRLTNADLAERKLSSFEEARKFVEDEIQGHRGEIERFLNREGIADPEQEFERLEADLENILLALSRLEQMKDTKGEEEEVKIVISKQDFLEEATAGHCPASGCFNPLTGIHREMPFVHALEANTFFAIAYNSSGAKIATAVLVLTDEGVIVFGDYNGSNLTLDPMWAETWKELSKYVPRIFLSGTSAGRRAADHLGSSADQKQFENTTVTRRPTMWSDPYFDYGKVNDDGSTTFDLKDIIVLTQDSVARNGGFEKTTELQRVWDAQRAAQVSPTRGAPEVQPAAETSEIAGPVAEDLARRHNQELSAAFSSALSEFLRSEQQKADGLRWSQNPNKVIGPLKKYIAEHGLTGLVSGFPEVAEIVGKVFPSDAADYNQMIVITKGLAESIAASSAANRSESRLTKHLLAFALTGASMLAAPFINQVSAQPRESETITRVQPGAEWPQAKAQARIRELMRVYNERIDRLPDSKQKDLLKKVAAALADNPPVYRPEKNYSESQPRVTYLNTTALETAADFMAIVTHEGLHHVVRIEEMKFVEEPKTVKFEFAEDLYDFVIPGEEGWVLLNAEQLLAELKITVPGTSTDFVPKSAFLNFNGSWINSAEIGNFILSSDQPLERRIFLIRMLPLIATNQKIFLHRPHMTPQIQAQAETFLRQLNGQAELLQVKAETQREAGRERAQLLRTVRDSLRVLNQLQVAAKRSKGEPLPLKAHVPSRVEEKAASETKRARSESRLDADVLRQQASGTRRSESRSNSAMLPEPPNPFGEQDETQGFLFDNNAVIPSNAALFQRLPLTDIQSILQTPGFTTPVIEYSLVLSNRVGGGTLAPLRPRNELDQYFEPGRQNRPTDRAANPAFQHLENASLWQALSEHPKIQAFLGAGTVNLFRVILMNPAFRAILGAEAPYSDGTRQVALLLALKMSQEAVRSKSGDLDVMVREIEREVKALHEQEQRDGRLFYSMGIEVEVEKRNAPSGFDDDSARALSVVFQQLLGGKLGFDPIIEYAFEPAYSAAVPARTLELMQDLGFIPPGKPHNMHVNTLMPEAYRNLETVSDAARSIAFIGSLLYTHKDRITRFTSDAWKAIDRKGDEIQKIAGEKPERTETEKELDKTRIEYRMHDSLNPDVLPFLHTLHGLLQQNVITAHNLVRNPQAEFTRIELEMAKLLDEFVKQMTLLQSERDGEFRLKYPVLDRDWFGTSSAQMGIDLNALKDDPEVMRRLNELAGGILERAQNLVNAAAAGEMQETVERVEVIKIDVIARLMQNMEQVPAQAAAQSYASYFQQMNAEASTRFTPPAARNYYHEYSMPASSYNLPDFADIDWDALRRPNEFKSIIPLYKAQLDFKNLEVIYKPSLWTRIVMMIARIPFIGLSLAQSLFRTYGLISALFQMLAVQAAQGLDAARNLLTAGASRQRQYENVQALINEYRARERMTRQQLFSWLGSKKSEGVFETLPRHTGKAFDALIEYNDLISRIGDRRLPETPSNAVRIKADLSDAELANALNEFQRLSNVFRDYESQRRPEEPRLRFDRPLNRASDYVVEVIRKISSRQVLADISQQTFIGDDQRPASRSESRKPSDHFLKALNLTNLDDFKAAGGRVLETFEVPGGRNSVPLTVTRVAITNPSIELPKNGIEWLHNELFRTSSLDAAAALNVPDSVTLDLLYDNGQVIAVFPADTQEMKDFTKQGINLLYLELAPYYMEIPAAGSLSNQEASGNWGDFTDNLVRRQNAIQSYRQRFAEQRAGQQVNLVSKLSTGEYPEPFVYVEVSADGKVTLDDFRPASYSAARYNQKKEGVFQAIIPIFPSVYSPVDAIKQDRTYYEGIANLGLNRDHRVLVGFAGSGFDTLLAFYAMGAPQGKQFDVFDANPMAIANIQAVAALAGFKANTKIVELSNPQASFPFEGPYDRVVGNMPFAQMQNLDTARQDPRMSTGLIWDRDLGGALISFARGLYQVLEANGQAHLWARIFTAQNGVNVVEQVLRYADAVNPSNGQPQAGVSPKMNVNVARIVDSTYEPGNIGVYRVTRLVEEGAAPIARTEVRDEDIEPFSPEALRTAIIGGLSLLAGLIFRLNDLQSWMGVILAGELVARIMRDMWPISIKNDPNDQGIALTSPKMDSGLDLSEMQLPETSPMDRFLNEDLRGFLESGETLLKWAASEDADDELFAVVDDEQFRDFLMELKVLIDYSKNLSVNQLIMLNSIRESQIHEMKVDNFDLDISLSAGDVLDDYRRIVEFIDQLHETARPVKNIARSESRIDGDLDRAEGIILLAAGYKPETVKTPADVENVLDHLNQALTILESLKGRSLDAAQQDRLRILDLRVREAHDQVLGKFNSILKPGDAGSRSENRLLFPTLADISTPSMNPAQITLDVRRQAQIRQDEIVQRMDGVVAAVGEKYQGFSTDEAVDYTLNGLRADLSSLSDVTEQKRMDDLAWSLANLLIFGETSALRSVYTVEGKLDYEKISADQKRLMDLIRENRGLAIDLVVNNPEREIMDIIWSNLKQLYDENLLGRLGVLLPKGSAFQRQSGLPVLPLSHAGDAQEAIQKGMKNPAGETPQGMLFTNDVNVHGKDLNLFTIIAKIHEIEDIELQKVAYLSVLYAMVRFLSLDPKMRAELLRKADLLEGFINKDPNLAGILKMNANGDAFLEAGALISRYYAAAQAAQRAA